MHRHYYRGDVGAAERMVPALVLIAIGGAFLLNNLHIVYFREIWRWWPAMVIAFGMVKLVDSPHPNGRIFGGILTGVGAFFLARNFGFIDLGMREAWPIILIGVGLWMLLQRTTPVPEAEPNDFSGNVLHESGVFTGAKRQITSREFRGGKVEVVFGGFDLDFTKADIAGDSATIKVEAVFGGVELRIPPSWTAEVGGSGVFGAFSDETLHPDPAHYPQVKRLIVKGSAVFGGVSVKN